MGFVFRKRIKTSRNSWVNVSKSGASVSRHVGPVTVNSRGRITLRLGRGMYWRF